MRIIWSLVCILLALTLLNACSSPVLPDETEPPMTAEATLAVRETPTGTDILPSQVEPAPTMFIPLIFQPAQEYLAQNLGIPLEEVILSSYELVEWPDSCLGLAGPDEMCLMVITPGHLAFFDTPAGQIEIHTDKSGRNFRLAPNPVLPSPGGTTPSGIGSGKELQMGGIRGLVTIGPNCPGPVSANEPCPDQPYQATITIFNERGEQVNQVQTRSDGVFTILLPPGTYTLHPEASGAYPRAEDLEVVVGASQLIEVRITYDSGMR